MREKTQTKNLKPQIRTHFRKFADQHEQTQAAGANLTYYETVLTNIAANPDLNFSQPGHTYAAVQQLVTTSAGGNIDDASATALSAFLA